MVTADRFSSGSLLLLTRRTAAIVVGATVLLVLVRMSQVALVSQDRGIGFDPRRQLIAESAYWGSWAITGIIVLASIDALRRRTTGLRQPLATSLLALPLLAALLVQPTFDTIGIVSVGAMAPEFTIPGMIIRKTLYNINNNLQILAAIVGVAFAATFYERYRERDTVARNLAGQLATARLDVLRAQLDPHFLFNSMNAIAMLARSGASDEVVRMVTGLSDFLRDSLDDGRPQIIPLWKELEFVERYLAIEQVRFQGRLFARIELDAKAKEVQIPSFILQPLVENAVRHGVSEGGGAVVVIQASIQNDKLVVTVRDEGSGLAATSRTGVGLRNSRARLAELYGDAATLRLENAPPPSIGAIATMEVPLALREGLPPSLQRA